MAILVFLMPCGVFYGHLVYFVPDGLLQLWYIFEGLGVENFGIVYGHFGIFNAMWCILRPLGIFCARWSILIPKLQLWYIFEGLGVETLVKFMAILVFLRPYGGVCYGHLVYF
jgi:hypothetical protein